MYNQCMKTCTRCKQEKDINQFNWRNKAKGQRLAWCKTCVKEYDKVRHSTDEYKDYKKIKLQERVEINQVFVFSHLKQNPCVDCGNDDIRVLEFDHKDDVEKVGNISEMIYRYSSAALLAEIEKCDVRCANCHRIRTADQFDTWKSGWKYKMHTEVWDMLHPKLNMS